MLYHPGRPMVVFSNKLNCFSGEAAQHGRPLQTTLVSLIIIFITKYKYLVCMCLLSNYYKIGVMKYYLRKHILPLYCKIKCVNKDVIIIILLGVVVNITI